MPLRARTGCEPASTSGGDRADEQEMRWRASWGEATTGQRGALPSGVTANGSWSGNVGIDVRSSPCILASPPSPPPPTPRTLRLDYFHTGSATEERFASDGLVTLEGPWPGNPGQSTGRAEPRQVLLRGDRTARPTGSSTPAGFASIYGEWETDRRSEGAFRTFHESVRFPGARGARPGRPEEARAGRRLPRGLVRARRPEGPDRSIAPRPPPTVRVWAVEENGEPATRWTCCSWATATPRPRWRSGTATRSGWRRRCSRSRRSRSAARTSTSGRLDTPSDESGVARPSDGVYRRSALRAAYDAFGSERYVLTFDNKRLREAAAAAPYEFIEIVVNDRKYGGGGIFNLYATVAADNALTPYVFVHEFGHHFAGLADEYYTSDVAYEAAPARPEPWEPNATADPAGREVEGPGDRGHAAAHALGEGGLRGDAEGRPGAPARDPRRGSAPRRRWTRSSARSARGRARCSRRARTRQRSAPSRGRCTRPRATTGRRPTASCSPGRMGFCAVCRRAIERVIDLLLARRPL